MLALGLCCVLPVLIRTAGGDSATCDPAAAERGTMEAPTIICVLGGPVDAEGRPKAHLALRLDTALAEAAKLEATGTAHRFLLTGGAVKSYGSAGVVTEASSMARYLTERGVPASAMLLEEEAVCTLTNAVYSKRLLMAAGLFESTTLLLVTSAGHMARAATCFVTLFPSARVRMGECAPRAGLLPLSPQPSHADARTAPAPDPAPEDLRDNLVRPPPPPSAPPFTSTQLRLCRAPCSLEKRRR